MRGFKRSITFRSLFPTAVIPLLVSCQSSPSKPEKQIPLEAPSKIQQIQETPKIVEAEPEEPGVQVDSGVSLDDALEGIECPQSVLEAQRLVNVRYYSFDGELHEGQIVIHKDLVKDVEEIFDEIEKLRFPISKVIPIEKYDWSDEASVADNNTSGFNYRRAVVSGKLSNHAHGRAIDINPIQNPYMVKVQGVMPTYDPTKPGTLTRDHPVTRAFLKRGWMWGGRWRHTKDYQHFEKP